MPTPDYPTVQTRRIPPKVRSPPYPVICWQSGERPESTQLRHRSVCLVIEEADVRRHLCPTERSSWRLIPFVW